MFFFSQSKWGAHHVSQGQTKQQTPAGSEALRADSLVFPSGHQPQSAGNILSRNENLRTELWHRVQGFHLASSEGKNDFLTQSINNQLMLLIMKFYELLFGHGSLNMEKYSKSIKFLYVVASVFFLFMLSFFYLVSFLCV